MTKLLKRLMAVAAFCVMSSTAFGAYASNLDKEQIRCLALNVYFESRGESKLGQHAVAWVTLNRVREDGYPPTICDVVYAPGAFSWTDDGKSDQPTDIMAWADAIIVAARVYEDFHQGEFDPTEGATMFHNTTAKPYWVASYEKTTRIDNHLFYR